MLLEFFQLLDDKLSKIDKIDNSMKSVEEFTESVKVKLEDVQSLKDRIAAMEQELQANTAWQNKFDELAAQLKASVNNLNLQ